MDLVTSFGAASPSLAARGSQPALGERPGKALAAAGTTRLEDLPFKTPQSGPGCPRAWQLEQGIDVWEPTGSLQ